MFWERGECRNSDYRCPYAHGKEFLTIPRVMYEFPAPDDEQITRLKEKQDKESGKTADSRAGNYEVSRNSESYPVPIGAPVRTDREHRDKSFMSKREYGHNKKEWSSKESSWQSDRNEGSQWTSDQSQQYSKSAWTSRTAEPQAQWKESWMPTLDNTTSQASSSEQYSRSSRWREDFTDDRKLTHRSRRYVPKTTETS